jgi:hypothetical protein
LWNVKKLWQFAQGAQPALYVAGYPVSDFHHDLVERKRVFVDPLAMDSDVIIQRIDSDLAFPQHDLFQHFGQLGVLLQHFYKVFDASPPDAGYALAAKATLCYWPAPCEEAAVLLALALQDIVHLAVLQQTIRQWNWVLLWHIQFLCSIWTKSMFFPPTRIRPLFVTNLEDSAKLWL